MTLLTFGQKEKGKHLSVFQLKIRIGQSHDCINELGVLLIQLDTAFIFFYGFSKIKQLMACMKSVEKLPFPAN